MDQPTNHLHLLEQHRYDREELNQDALITTGNFATTFTRFGAVSINSELNANLSNLPAMYSATAFSSPFLHHD
jgi:hypothetical protein